MKFIYIFAYVGVAGSINRPTLSQFSAVFIAAKPFNFSTISPNELRIFDEQKLLAIKWLIILLDI